MFDSRMSQVVELWHDDFRLVLVNVVFSYVNAAASCPFGRYILLCNTHCILVSKLVCHFVQFVEMFHGRRDNIKITTVVMSSNSDSERHFHMSNASPSVIIIKS